MCDDWLNLNPVRLLSWGQIPQRRKSNQPLSRDHWAHVHLRTNTFTWGEWPEQELQPSGEFSIGEEQSPSTVTWLAWSPPGLAKHKRSVLAVLTSNHVLSLWASASDMAVPESWERVCLVNDAVKAALRDEKFKSRFKSVSSLRWRRIRSAAWAPLRDLIGFDDSGDIIAKEALQRHGAHSDRHGALETSGADSHLSLPTTQQLLAVANDCGSLCILKVCSPSTSNLNVWEAAVVEMYFLPTHGHMVSNQFKKLFQAGPSDDAVYHRPVEHQDLEQQKIQEGLDARPSLLAAAFDQVNFIDGVSWSPWIRDLAQVADRNTLTITRNGVLSQLSFQITLKQDNIRCDCSDLMTRKQDIREPAQRSTVWLHRVQLLSP